MNGIESFGFAESILDALLRLMELYTRIALIGAIVITAFTLASIVYLCFKEVATGEGSYVKKRSKTTSVRPRQWGNRNVRRERTQHISLR